MNWLKKIFKRHRLNPNKYNINSMFSSLFRIVNIASTRTHKHIQLTKEEMLNGCKLGLDSWADSHSWQVLDLWLWWWRCVFHIQFINGIKPTTEVTVNCANNTGRFQHRVPSLSNCVQKERHNKCRRPCTLMGYRTCYCEANSTSHYSSVFTKLYSKTIELMFVCHPASS